MRVINDILRQHAENAAFLWVQRRGLDEEDPPDPDAIADTDARLAAEIDALAIAGPDVWPVLDAMIALFCEPGEVFVCALSAITQGDAQRVSDLVTLAQGNDAMAGFDGAIAYSDGPRLAPFVRDWWGSNDPARRTLAARAYRIKGGCPQTILDQMLKAEDRDLCAEGLRIMAQKRSAAGVVQAQRVMQNDDPYLRRLAALALAAVGQGDMALPVLQAAALAPGARGRAAMRAALEVMGAQKGQRWLTGLLNDPVTEPAAVRGIGMIGDRAVLSWLVEIMARPTVASAAAAAFQDIAGRVDEPDAFFHPDTESAAEVMGAAFVDAPEPVPVQARFAGLIG